MSEKLMRAIKGLECCLKTESMTECQMKYCPYHKCRETCSEWLMKDILSLLKAREPKFGRWKQAPAGMTPGGTPLYICGNCGESNHLYGVEYPKRKIVCDCCGQINIYPGEEAWEEGSSLWPKEERT